VLRATLAEYERARENGRYFLCAPGHEITIDGMGAVVHREDRFVVVEKRGVAGAVAEANDPRRRSGMH